MKQSYYEPGMPRDVLFNNNVPAGIWDDTEENGPLSEFQDLDDYPQYYQPACEYPFKLTVLKHLKICLPPPTHTKKELMSHHLKFLSASVSSQMSDFKFAFHLVQYSMHNSFDHVPLLLLLSTVSAPPHHQQQQRPYDNFQHIMSSDNLYDEPLALPIKYKYPTRFFDERRKRGVNKNIMR